MGELNLIATPRTNYLVDTDVFILWQHHPLPLTNARPTPKYRIEPSYQPDVRLV